MKLTKIKTKSTSGLKSGNILVIVASRFFTVIYSSACDPLLLLFVYVIKVKYVLQDITVPKV
jgi:energy-converting hydrogenase Eha subunit C